jgi:hypothetical protein
VSLLIVYAVVALAGAILSLWWQPPLPHAWPLLAIAAMPQLLSLIGIRGLALFGVTVISLTLWCWQNRTLPGVAWVTAGLAMNLLVMGFHDGAMPIHSDSLRALGHTIAPGTVLIGSKDVVVNGALFGFLGDWIVVDWLPTRLVASPGDVLVVMGILWWLRSGVRHPAATVQPST